MKRICYILLACVLILGACKTEEEKQYDNTGTEIIYDEYMDPLMRYGTYTYSNLDDQVQVKFGVDAAAASVQVSMQPQGGTYGPAQTVQVSSDKTCMVTYSRTDLNWTRDMDTAMVKITNAGVTKEIYLVTIPAWVNLAKYKAGEEASTIVPGISYAPIESKQVNDTIIFTATADSWINVDGATWTMNYKKGKTGSPVTVTPVATDKKNSVKFIYSMAGLDIVSKDTLFVSASITNNGISRTGSYAIIAQEIATAMSSKVTNGETFGPSIGKGANDTITMQAVVLKSGTNRSWLKAAGSAWTAAYTVGTSKTPYNFGGTVKIESENDTMSVAQIIGALGRLPNVAQYDTVHMTGTMNINGAKYLVEQSYVVSK